MPGPNLILIGYRGCGKTVVGRALAARLHWPYVDTDERVEALTGRSIHDIFAADGERFFRRMEARAIAQLVRLGQHVIAAGGGVVLSAANRAALRKTGTCVWLTAPATELYRRIQADPRSAGTRPALSGSGGLGEVRHLLATRRPLYAATAHRVVSTRGRSIAEVVDAVLDAVAVDGVLPEAP